MRMFGEKIEGPNEELVVFPRPNEKFLAFKVRAILSTDIFDKMCPIPQPPIIMKPGGKKTPNVDDKSFKKAVEDWSTKRTAWTVITALQATDGLTWDEVVYDDPNTWHLYEKELRESGLSEYEIAKIVNTVFSVNSLDEEKLEEARKRFLAIQAEAQKEQSSQNGDQETMPSGERVNGSASAHPELKQLTAGTR